MVRQVAKFVVVFTLVAFSASTTLAQQVPRETEKPSSNGPRKQLATILFAGLGGAVLGLSTLSFYGRPQDKLENIAIGFAVGVIENLGGAYVVGTELKLTLALVIIITVLTLKPSGLMGRKVYSRV